MKFSLKIVMGTTIIIAALFSIAGTYMVEKNFDIAYEKAVDTNTKEHILGRYSLESGVLNAIEDGEIYSNELICNYAGKMINYSDSSVSLMISDTSGYFYTNIDDNIFEDIKEYKIDNDKYIIYKFEEKVYIVISSKITISEESFTIVNLYDISDVFFEKHRQLIMLFKTDVVIIIAAIICVYILSLLLTINIKKMIVSSKKIAEGNYSERTQIKSKDEIGELSTNFDAMACAIEKHIDKLNEDIHNREDFVSNFSHELKTPMTAMMGYSKMLMKKDCDNDIKDKSVKYIYKECKRLEILSQKLLLMLGITQEKIQLQDVYCRWLGEQIERTVNPFIDRVDVKIELEEGCIKGDASLLIDMFKNLIENAVRACNEKKQENYKGHIIFTGNVMIESDNKKIYVFSVKDNGIGINSEEISKITNAFYMVDKSRSRNSGGSGLGLSICKKICDIHNTEMRIESTYGEGTTINILFECIDNMTQQPKDNYIGVGIEVNNDEEDN